MRFLHLKPAESSSRNSDEPRTDTIAKICADKGERHEFSRPLIQTYMIAAKRLILCIYTRRVSIVFFPRQAKALAEKRTKKKFIKTKKNNGPFL
jgi:hypothetical protein